MFISFEGPEGAGKSVNIAWLAAWLTERGHEVVVAREPGGTALGEQVRTLLLDTACPASPLAALFLFEAARAQLVHDVVRPALAAGTIVLSDRFADSTLAYQGFGDGLPRDRVELLNDLATGGLSPDLTVLLDLDPALGLARRRDSDDWNAIDARELTYHERVRDGFISLARDNPARWLIVDAALPLTEVRESIVTRLSVWQNEQKAVGLQRRASDHLA